MTLLEAKTDLEYLSRWVRRAEEEVAAGPVSGSRGELFERLIEHTQDVRNEVAQTEAALLAGQ